MRAVAGTGGMTRRLSMLHMSDISCPADDVMHNASLHHTFKELEFLQRSIIGVSIICKHRGEFCPQTDLSFRILRQVPQRLLCKVSVPNSAKGYQAGVPMSDQRLWFHDQHRGT